MLFLVLVLFLLQSSIKFPSRSKQMHPVRARQQNFSCRLNCSCAFCLCHSCIIRKDFCNLSDCPPLHLVCVFLIFPQFGSHMLIPLCFDLVITDTADPSIKETPHCLNPSFLLQLCRSSMLLLFLLPRACVMTSLLIPISVNVLKHVQVISHRRNVSLVRHVCVFCTIAFPFNSQSDLSFPKSEFSFDCPKRGPKSSASSFPSSCSSFFPPQLCFVPIKENLSSCCPRLFPGFFGTNPPTYSALGPGDFSGTNDFQPAFHQAGHFGLHLVVKCFGNRAVSKHELFHIRWNFPRATVGNTRHIQVSLETRSTKGDVRLSDREQVSRRRSVTIFTTSNQRIVTLATGGTQRSWFRWSCTELQQLRTKRSQHAQRRVHCEPCLIRLHHCDS